MDPKIEAKSWNPMLEKETLRKWESEDIYAFSTTSETGAFVIDSPPPYPSGRPWHIGAAAHYAQIDMIARFARMSGYNVMFPIGIDRNGLPVEIYTEKKHKIRMRKMKREAFLDLCRVALDDLEAEMIQIMKNMGLSCNFKQYYRTDSDEFRALTQNTFIDLWKRHLVYLATRPNNYCSDCGTTIADAEIIYEDLPTKLVYMNFTVKETSEKLVIASTRPELLFACQCIIVNPKDGRYLQFHRKHVEIPIFGREVKILPHHSAKAEFGSGVVMVCSYGDQNDVQLFRELGLKEIVAINENGITTPAAGPYSNLTLKEARAKIIEDLNTAGLIDRVEDIVHRTPLCERSKTSIEIIPMEDYYLKQLEYIPKLKDLAEEITFYPPMHKQILINWLNSVSIDWPISRRRFYGTEIPIWYCNNCRTPNLPDSTITDKYYRPWKEKPPFEKCIQCDCTEFTGEDRIFDTWMDSSITPLFISKYKRDQKLYNHLYPTNIRPQAKDIIRTWLYYSMLRCFQLTDKVPWSSAWIMGYGVDEKGEKMSKSKGNVIDPFPIIHHYGADAFRFWSASEGSLGHDFRCSEQRIAGSKNFLSKLWNIGRFISSFDILAETPAQLFATDEWIISELSILIEDCKKGYNDFNFFVPSNAIREFTRNLFAAHYIEMVKARAYNQEDSIGHKSAIFTLHLCLSTILLLLAPICPFITEELWTKIYSAKSIHVQHLPDFSQRDYHKLSNYTGLITDFNSKVWNKKKETILEKTGKPLSLKDPVEISIPTELNLFKKDLKLMHNLIEK
ncbi:MAG: valine--tRNA ligase [Nitrososphaeraceae archaeon]|nr:valine--tRNA ligase [Nitrososphaeraceae archaeon]MDW0331970.1 valine--tRNA ligase [Nitrososphaeraceae archaeon]